MRMVRMGCPHPARLQRSGRFRVRFFQRKEKGPEVDAVAKQRQLILDEIAFFKGSPVGRVHVEAVDRLIEEVRKAASTAAEERRE